MPGFDGTGPLGKGSLSGKGLGYCVVKLNSTTAELDEEKRKGVFDMPRGDGTGPMGSGPMTGRGVGFCAGYSMPGYTNPMPGRGSLGRGGGRGRRNWFYATGLPGWQRASMEMPALGGSYPYTSEMTSKQEAYLLKNQADFLKKQLEDIQIRIETLEKASIEKDA